MMSTVMDHLNRIKQDGTEGFSGKGKILPIEVLSSVPKGTMILATHAPHLSPSGMTCITGAFFYAPRAVSRLWEGR